MISMIIEGTQIDFTGKPKHKAVMAARNLMSEVTMNMMDLTKFDQSKPLMEAVQEMIAADPTFTAKLESAKTTVEIDQTIMLATGLEYNTLCMLRDEMYEAQYIEMYEKSKESLGGKCASDFFGFYPSNTISKEAEAEMAKLLNA